MLKTACCTFEIKFCLSLPSGMLFAFSSTVSRLPYCCSSFRAVFSPTPGTPGMLSDLSPISPLRSISPAGSSPYLSFTLLLSQSSKSDTPLLVYITFTLSLTSCRASRSPVTMSTSMPSCSPYRERVPITSSASKPAASIRFISMASKRSFNTGTCTARSSGMPFLWAL